MVFDKNRIEFYGNYELFYKREKKLSDEDLKNWDELKKTLDFKFYKKSYQITDLKKTKQLYKDHNKVDNYKLKQNKIVKHGTVNRKFLYNYQLQDIRIDKNKLSLLKKIPQNLVLIIKKLKTLMMARTNWVTYFYRWKLNNPFL